MFRVSKGNVWINLVDINSPIIDPIDVNNIYIPI